MGRRAEKVFTEPQQVERIERLVTELPSQARVRITMCNGDVVSGTVTERPALQLYEDVSGAEGLNAELRLDDPAVPASIYVWLGDIERVEPMTRQN
jgi:hypothetical protein